VSARGKQVEAGLPGEREVPEVLHGLFQEHRHLNALVRVMLNKANQTERLNQVDYFLLRDIVGYLHDYPNEVHHPTEDLMFDKLLRRKPGTRKAVQRITRDHQVVAKKTQELIDLLDRTIDQPGRQDEIAVRLACREFGWHQQEHMKFEDLELFPEAFESLTPSDWRYLEKRLAAVNDPLFGRVVGNAHRLLYEYLIDAESTTPARLKRLVPRTLSSVARTGSIMRQGVGSSCIRLGKLGQLIAGETVSTMRKSLKPESILGTVRLPVDYAAFLGHSMIGCGNDLAAIWLKSMRDTVNLYRPPGRSR